MKPWEVMQARKAQVDEPKKARKARKKKAPTPTGSIDPGEEIRVIIEGCPVPKQRPRAGKGGRMYTPKKTRKYERLVADMARLAYGGDPVDHDVEVRMAIFWPDRRRRDLDNTVKSILDGFNGVIYVDDYFVQRLVVERYIDRERPRAEVVIVAVEVES